MSYLLNQIDNKRSDDEDEVLNRLFPKCKPRASSLSLSPSLQHISNDSTSTSSTSASDLCLNSLSYSTPPTNDNQLTTNNSNLSHLDPNAGLNRYSNRRHSANSNQVNLDSISNSHSSQNNLWNSEECNIFSSNAQEIPSYENNNIESNLWANSAETLNNCNFPPSDRGHHQRQTNKSRKCDNQKNTSSKNYKCDKRVSMSGCQTFNKSGIYIAPPALKLEQEINENKNGVTDANFPSVISHNKPQEVGLCNLKSASSPLASQRRMEHNNAIVEDNFDNGIGSGCSRSSGESTHSNTSDFMENFMSPVVSLHGRVASGTTVGMKGHPQNSISNVLTPSIASLRDSRIEIAGGREIYSQNRIRASRRHRGSSHTILSSNNEIMLETVPCSISSSKIRKKPLHSHTPYQQQHQQLHHCCHTTSPCCGPTNDCSEVGLPHHGSMVWEPNHSCNSRQQYLSHSHSFGGTSQDVKCTGACGCCGHHSGFDYSKATAGAEFEGSRMCSSSSSRNLTKLHSSPTSPMTMRETVFAAEVRSIEKSAPRGVQVAEKSMLHCELESPCHIIEPVIYEAVVGDGKVVFDDIGEWRERHGDIGGYEGGDEHDINESQQIAIKRQAQTLMSSTSKDKEEAPATSNIPRSKRPAGFGQNNTEPSESSPCASNRDGNTTPSGYESDECSASVCTNTSILSSVTNLKTSPNFGNKRLIGNIPIVEYIGSPRRFGLKQTVSPVTTHFDLIDVDMGGGIHRESDAVITDPNAQTLMDQTIATAAATSSSSSSLDNTNTNVSSNSSSRTNNLTSPRALSPSQPISAFSRFPGFPQRVNATSTVASNESTRGGVSGSQPCPILDYSNPNSNLASHHDNRELLNDMNGIDICGKQQEEQNETIFLSQDQAPCSSTSTVSTDQLIPSSLSLYQNGQTTSSELNGMKCNFLMDSSESRISTLTDSSNQDFLYEFSETRKVLEEFFNVAGNQGCVGPYKADDELHYMLRRQAGNSYVGQRLASDVAGNLVTEDSPKKPTRRGVLLLDDGDGSDEKGSPKLISFQEISLPQLHSLQQPQYKTSQLPTQSLTAPSARSPRSLKTHSRSQSQSPPPPPLHDPTRDDINNNDIDAETASTNTETDLGETEVVGLQVGRGRNFSPETTDCDSNELESELSLEYEASLHSSCRARPDLAIRPVVDDGLSSGNESENEEIIEVDVGFQEDDCYLLGSTIKHHAPLAKKPNDIPSDAKLFACEENKENILGMGNSENCSGNILTWSNVDDLIQNIHDESKAQAHNCSDPNPTLMLMKKQISEIEKEIQLRASQQSHRMQSNGTGILVDTEIDMNTNNEIPDTSPTNSCISLSNRRNDSKNPFSVSDTETIDPDCVTTNHDPELDALDPMRTTPPPSPAPGSTVRQHNNYSHPNGTMRMSNPDTMPKNIANFNPPSTSFAENRSDPICVSTSSGSGGMQFSNSPPSSSVAAAIQDIKEAIQRAKPLSQPRHTSVSTSTPIIGSASCSSSHNRIGLGGESQSHESPVSHERVPLLCDSSPVWVPRNPRSARIRDLRSDSCGSKDPLLKKQRYEDVPDEDDDTDQETNRLLGQTRNEDDCGFYDEKDWKKPKSRTLLNKGVAFVKSATSAPSQAPLLSTSASIAGGHAGLSASNSFNSTTINNCSFPNANNVSSTTSATTNNSSTQQLLHSLSPSTSFDDSQLPSSVSSTAASKSKKQEKDGVKKKRSKEDLLKNPSVLIEGVLFRARYLGSTQLTCEGQPTKATRMTQAEEAVSRIKAENSVNSTNELQQGTTPKSPNLKAGLPPASAPCCHHMSPNNELRATKLLDFDKSANCAEETLEENELDEYFYGGEDVESCCGGDSDGEEELFVKSHPSSGSLQDNKGRRLPLEDIHGSSNALQAHDNHALPLSLHHNRQSSGGNGETCSSGVTQAPFLNVSPPCGTALPGTMFRLRFIGSMEVDEEIGSGKRRRKRHKKQMVEEAVMKIKSMAPEGETQPSTEVDLFISTEKIMVLNTDLKEIMMDHALRTISYIADIGDLVVLMARRRPVPSDPIDESKPARLPKMICHVFESDEAQYIAQSIGQAFQVAYMEFLKANGIEDSSFVREMDYQEVLNSQEIFGDELQMFAKKELQKEVVVPKSKGEILGVVIVESGWGSMLPTVVIANLAPAGAAARCGQLNIGDQIIAINGVSLVGLPLSTCQNYIKNTKNQTVVKLTVVPCPPVVEVKIKRPDTKYQLGFSVQNGVICSLLRGGIAERGGVRVGHRIIEINSQSVVAVPHEKIVNLLATSVGEINMKTMPTSMFRLLTGQETPLYI